jgi:hypothetical protein
MVSRFASLVCFKLPSLRAAAGALGILAAATGTIRCAPAHTPNTANESRALTEVANAPPAPEPAAAPEPSPLKELPRGGRTLFPTYRLVGYCGTPGAPALGALDSNHPVKAKALETRAAQFAGDRKVLPVFELIAVVVEGAPGVDGKYRNRVKNEVVDEYLRAAREAKALLLLNIQPGQSDFITELALLEPYLEEPDVGVALDPEWAMHPKQRPGLFWGQTTGETINEVADMLSGIVKRLNLPEKALVFHEVVKGVVKNERAIVTHPGVALIKSVDGLGAPNAKIATYGNLMGVKTKGVHAGFKLFFDEDTRGGSHLMGPHDVLALQPRPEYVMFE